MTSAAEGVAVAGRGTLPALIGGQACVHACMTGVRVAAPLLVLGEGGSPAQVGLLLGLFAAAPVLMSLHAGRFADRHGYHLPLRLAVGLAVAGALLAALAAALDLPRWLHFGVLGAAAVLCGIGANVAMIVVQRSAGRLAAAMAAAAAAQAGAAASSPNAALTRVFSWLGLGPAVASMVGPVIAGTLVDRAGFAAAFGALALLPLLSLVLARRVPVEPPPARPPDGAGGRRPAAWTLFRSPGLKRLMAVNWLVSSSWDLHAFLVPVLGHQRGFSASAIGAVLGVFAAAVAGVRLLMPLLLDRRARRPRDSRLLSGAMLTVVAVFAVYPLVSRPLPMALCAALLGLALGAVQPLLLTALHRLTPAHRHGEAIALRSMTMNSSSAVMPLVFGASGALLGAGSLFWLMAAAVAAGSVLARRVGEPA